MASPCDNTRLACFIRFLPMEFIAETMMPATNKTLEPPMDKKEFLVFIGMFLHVSLFPGNSRRDSFTLDHVDALGTVAPVRLNHCMSGRRFVAIISNLKFTDKPPPSHKDGVWEV